MSATSIPVVLTGWKEIATYLGRGVRTVQRYEEQLNLPVGRVQYKSGCSVIALVPALDAWVKGSRESEDVAANIQCARALMALQGHQKAILELNDNVACLQETIFDSKQLVSRAGQAGEDT